MGAGPACGSASTFSSLQGRGEGGGHGGRVQVAHGQGAVVRLDVAGTAGQEHEGLLAPSIISIPGLRPPFPINFVVVMNVSGSPSVCTALIMSLYEVAALLPNATHRLSSCELKSAAPSPSNTQHGMLRPFIPPDPCPLSPFFDLHSLIKTPLCFLLLSSSQTGFNKPLAQPQSLQHPTCSHNPVHRTRSFPVLFHILPFLWGSVPDVDHFVLNTQRFFVPAISLSLFGFFYRCHATLSLERVPCA